MIAGVVEGDARSLSQDAQEALRVRGVKLLQEGCTQAEVAEHLGVRERQVRRWQKRFQRGGWMALAKRRRGVDRRDPQLVWVPALDRVHQLRLLEPPAPQIPSPPTVISQSGAP